MVNINPAIFNLVVCVHERLKEAGIRPDRESFREFEASYLDEEENGQAHRIDGRAYTAAGSIGRLLADIIGPEET